jgi:hypothetical protein
MDISPNADGTDDVAQVKYSIGRPANVSIYFVDAAGKRHYFRESQRRSPGDYDVYWGGVINEPEMRAVPGGAMRVDSQVLPDGDYTWVIEATDDAGRTEKTEGRITVQGGDTSLPEIHNFTVVPQEFRPNQDGLRDDWVSIAYYLTKDAETIRLYLVPETPGPGEENLKYPIAEKPLVAQSGDAGYHEARYEGGVDQNAEPPPDGNYRIFAEAADKMGNRVAVSSTLTILEGGKPRAEIAGGEID